MLSTIEIDKISLILYRQFQYQNPIPCFRREESGTVFQKRLQQWHFDQNDFIRRKREQWLIDEKQARLLLEIEQAKKELLLEAERTEEESVKIKKPYKKAVKETVDENKFFIIRSPMITGLFYVAAEQEGTPFVSVGQSVTPNTVVCLLEACKVFSEIKAKVYGIVRKVYPKDKDIINYGDPLFGIELDSNK